MFAQAARGRCLSELEADELLVAAMQDLYILDDKDRNHKEEQVEDKSDNKKKNKTNHKNYHSDRSGGFMAYINRKKWKWFKFLASSLTTIIINFLRSTRRGCEVINLSL